MNYVKGIALSGKNRAGKDATAKAIQSISSPMEVRRFAFADSLKREAARLVDKPLDFFFDDQNKIGHRSFLIALGSAGRAYDPLFWVKRSLAEIEKAKEFDRLIPVITDLRFTNEAKALKEAGFLLVRIECPDHIRLARGGSVLEDESETGLDGWAQWDHIAYSDSQSPQEIAAEVLREFLFPEPEVFT